MHLRELLKIFQNKHDYDNYFYNKNKWWCQKQVFFCIRQRGEILRCFSESQMLSAQWVVASDMPFSTAFSNVKICQYDELFLPTMWNIWWRRRCALFRLSTGTGLETLDLRVTMCVYGVDVCWVPAIHIKFRLTSTNELSELPPLVLFWCYFLSFCSIRGVTRLREERRFRKKVCEGGHFQATKDDSLCDRKKKKKKKERKKDIDK